MKVAVVENRDRGGIIQRFGQACPEVYAAKTVASVVAALQSAGHVVEVFEGDKVLLDRLERFLTPGAAADGLVFNMAYGIQGESRYTHVPAMLEMAGVAYTGAGPLGHAISLDKVVTKQVIASAGVPTPAYRVFRAPGDSDAGLRYPLIAKPRHESTSFGLQVVDTRHDLDAAVAAIVSEYRQDALVEEFVEGREVCVALLGNDRPEVLPIVEQDFGRRDAQVLTYHDKYHLASDSVVKICPAVLEPGLAATIAAIAVDTFRACHCRDYARVDFRIDRDGRPFVLEINSMASLGGGGSYVLAAARAGYDFPDLVNRIVDLARGRAAASLQRERPAILLPDNSGTQRNSQWPSRTDGPGGVWQSANAHRELSGSPR
jgi:D-alanine-D-alanine ligase